MQRKQLDGRDLRHRRTPGFKANDAERTGQRVRHRSVLRHMVGAVNDACPLHRTIERQDPR